METAKVEQGTKVTAGTYVKYSDPHGVKHNALVTNVFGGWGPDNEPSVNVVYVTRDSDKSDPYGRQIERNTSVVHKSNQAAHGMFWDYK